MRDVSRLHGFLASKNPQAARRAVAAIRQSLRLLEKHPEAGRPVEEMPTEFREWPIGVGGSGYAALYHVDRREVAVLAIRHGRELGHGASSAIFVDQGDGL